MEGRMKSQIQNAGEEYKGREGWMTDWGLNSYFENAGEANWQRRAERGVQIEIADRQRGGGLNGEKRIEAAGQIEIAD